MGIAALVLGILAMVFSIIPLIGAMAFWLAIPAGLLAIAQLIFCKKKGLAIAGLVLAIVASIISYLQYEGAKALGEQLDKDFAYMEQGSQEFKKPATNQQPTMEISTEQEVIHEDVKTEEEAPQPIVEEKIEPLKINGLYRLNNSAGKVEVIELENVTDDTIAVFRGNMIICDDFGKEKDRKTIYYKYNIAPKSVVVFAEISGSGQSQSFIADSMSELGDVLPLPYYRLKVDTQVKFECTDIKYVE